MGKKNKLFRDRFSQNSPRGPLLAILSDVRTAGSPLKKDEPWLEFQSHLVASPTETALPQLRPRSRLARANSRVTDFEIGIMEQTSSKSCPAFAKPAANAQPVASPLPIANRSGYERSTPIAAISIFMSSHTARFAEGCRSKYAGW